MRFCSAFVLTTFLVLSSFAQAPSRWAGAGQYDPGPGQPWGQRSPQAPPETEQFAFMVGQFLCDDRIPQRDGTVLEFQSTWNAHYFMNGTGILDHNSGPQRSTSNVRLYDAATGQWRVTWFAMPTYSTGTWVGARTGETFVLNRDIVVNGSEAVSRLTFYHITDDGYDWKAETLLGEQVIPGWMKSCRRRSTE